MTDTDKGTTRVVASSSSGEYLVHDLIPDHYRFKIEAPGFATLESDVITVSADSSAQVNFQLKPGAASQTVEVTAEAPQLKTDRADVSTTLEYAYGGGNTEPDSKYHQPCLACPSYDRFDIFECQC